MSSKIVFGTGSRFGKLNKNLCLRLVEYSFKKGVRKFDTGHSYANGNSEKNLGYALQHLKNFKRNKVFISTKVGTSISNRGILYKDFSASSIDSQVNSSLKNLNLKYIDLLYLHGPEIKDINNQELIEKLIDLKNKGLIRKIGVNTHTTSLIEEIAAGKTMYFDQIMIDFNLLQLDRIVLMKKCKKINIKVCAGTVLAQGLLLDSPIKLAFRSRSIFYILRMIFKKETRELIKYSKSLRNFLKKRFNSLSEKIPLSFVLNNIYVNEVSIGMLSKKSIDKNLSIANNPIHLKICDEVAEWSALHSQL